MENDLIAFLLACGKIRRLYLQSARDISNVANIDANSPGLRLAIVTLFMALAKGDAFINVTQAADLIIDGIPQNLEKEKKREIANSIRDIWNRDVMALLASAGDALVAHANKEIDTISAPLVLNGDNLYFQKYYLAIHQVSQKFQELADRPPQSPAIDIGKSMKFSFTLEKEQIFAVEKALNLKFAVITGGPGTGKTTIICAILRALVANGFKANDISLAAPTGRAAQRMRESIQSELKKAENVSQAECIEIPSIEAATIHSILGGRAPDFNHNSGNRLRQRVVIVDEVSMIDLELMRHLLRALADDCKLILIGDRDQLPSVDAGAVLGDIVGDPNNPPKHVATLTKTHRFSGALKDCASALKPGGSARDDTQEIPFSAKLKITREADAANEFFTMNSNWQNTDGKCVWIVPDRERQTNFTFFENWIRRFGLSGKGELQKCAEKFNAEAIRMCRTAPKDIVSDAQKILTLLENSRILCATHGGLYGCTTLNREILRLRTNATPEYAIRNLPGIPVIITRNTKSRRLFNGDTGITVSSESGAIHVIFPRGDEIVSCPAALLPPHDLAYAITIHKSQGSQYNHALVVLPETADRNFVTRELLYTGITRAKKNAVIFATQQILMQAINTSGKRNSGVKIV